MESRKEVLPMVYPSLTSWTWHANLFAMIEQMPNAQKWIFSNYIQVHCHPEIVNKRKLHLDFFPLYKTFFECPLVHTQYIDREFIFKGWKDIKDFLIYCIEQKYYVYGVCNEKWILGCDEDYYHELFVYGYDLEQEICYVADFTLENNGRYSLKKVPFESVCKGFEDVTKENDYLLRHEGGFVLSRYAPQIENKYELDLGLIKTNLYEYLEGINSHYHFREYYNMGSMEMNAEGEKVETYVFGIKIYDYLKDYLNCSKTIFDIDIRPFQNMYDHKKLMLERIKYLIKNDFIKCSEKEIQKYEMLVEESHKIVFILLKNAIKMKKERMDYVIESLEKIKCEEKEVLMKVYSQL